MDEAPQWFEPLLSNSEAGATDSKFMSPPEPYFETESPLHWRWGLCGGRQGSKSGALMMGISQEPLPLHAVRTQQRLPSANQEEGPRR